MAVSRAGHKPGLKFGLWIAIGLLIFVKCTSAKEKLQETYQSYRSDGTQIPSGNNGGTKSSQETTGVSTETFSTDGRTSSVQNQPPVPIESAKHHPSASGLASLVFVAAVISLCVVGCVAFVGGMYCWYKHSGMLSSARRVFYRSSDSRVLIHNDYQPMGDERESNHNGTTNNNLAKLAEKTDYPAYGVTGPNPLHCTNKGPPIDLNLTRNAEVYHYQQQKQRLKKLNSVSSTGSSQSKHSTPESSHDPTADANQGDEENSDGEYTVYECPGLAAASDGPLEIHNPLFANSESNMSSYSTTTLGDTIVTSKYDYSTTVGGR